MIFINLDFLHTFSLLPYLAPKAPENIRVCIWYLEFFWRITTSIGIIIVYEPAGVMDLLHKSQNGPVPYPTMHLFVTEMCTCVHISVTQWGIVWYMHNALLYLCDVSIDSMYPHTRICTFNTPSWLHSKREMRKKHEKQLLWFPSVEYTYT